jgi:hypothetical protein
MRWQWLGMLLAAATLLPVAVPLAAAQERYVGVRRDAAGEIILFSLEPFGGAERKIATLQKSAANITLLGITTLNARRGTFTYAYTDVAAGKDFLHTVNLSNGQTIARITLPADVTGLEAVSDAATPARELQSDKDAMRRKLEALEQDVRRLQSQVRPR